MSRLDLSKHPRISGGVLGMKVVDEYTAVPSSSINLLQVRPGCLTYRFVTRTTFAS